MPSQKLASVLWLGAALAVVILPTAGALPPPPSSNCKRNCGQVEIPYPFGIGPDSPDHCAMPGFNLSCNDTGNGIFKPYHTNVEFLNISLEQGQARVLNHISSYCYNSNGNGQMDPDEWRLNFTHLPYRFSDTSNMFTVIGCRTLAYIGDYNYADSYMSGCVAMCRSHGNVTTLTNGSCSGMGCCQTSIPKALKYYQVWFDHHFNTSQIYNTSPCSYAVLMESSNFTFLTSYVTSSEFYDADSGRVPLVVDWAIGNENCARAQNKPDSYACVSPNSKCVDSLNGKGYICKCSAGFRGNPYLQDPENGGCKDIDECTELPSPCSLNAHCHNTNGSYQCYCPRAYPDGDARNGTCVKAFPLKAKLTIGVCASVLAGLLLFIGTEWIKYKQQITRQDHERMLNDYFLQNGGQLLMDMMEAERDITFKLYDRVQIESATNNFSNSAIIGQGGQGTVYKGHNLDPENNPVAIKICKGFDESRRMEFGKELLILSRVSHENIVRLIGCSLQFDVPVLVYEFVLNKTLHYLIHDQHDPSFRTLDIRLKIAVQSAEALAYLHSLNRPIFHGDVKSANILLAHDLSPKVSDFGCSMIRSTHENHQVLKGTLGYIDPEYLVNYELSDKSDVYSFGVVLLELLTRRTALSQEKESLTSVFQKAVENRNLIELIDNEIIGDEDSMEVVHLVANLACRCLVMSGERRPTMSTVVEELRGVVDLVCQHRGGQQPVVPVTLAIRSAEVTSECYTGGETTDYYSLTKIDSMSIEFAGSLWMQYSSFGTMKLVIQ